MWFSYWMEKKWRHQELRLSSAAQVRGRLAEDVPEGVAVSPARY